MENALANQREMFIFRRFALVLLLFSCLSCQTAGKVAVGDKVPAWVPGAAKVPGKVCAIGSSEPTFYKEEGKGIAAENARKELARSLSMSVHSVMIDVRENRGSSTEEASMLEVSSWAAEAVISNSVIEAYWYDESGVASFKRRGITYALACVPDTVVRKK